MISLPLVHYALTAAVRDKVVLALAAGIVFACLLSVFMGGVAVIEQDYFAIVFSASGLRMSVVLGLVLFVSFYVRRSFDTKDVEFLLSRPISRLSYVGSHIAAFVMIASLMAVVQGISLYILGGHLFGAGHWLWVFSVWIENIMMVAVALFFSMYLSSATTAALSCFGFYALARMMGTVLGSLDVGTSVDSFGVTKMIMEAVSLVIPRLDLFAQSSWLIYGVADMVDVWVVALQGVTFTSIVIVATIIDLVRREF